MEHKIYMNYIHPSSLLRQLAVLWRSDQLCDAVITVDKIIVSKAHKLVLFAVSPKLSEESKSSSQSPILDVTLPTGVGHKAVHSFLQYIYEGYLILTQDIASDLLKIANYLEIKCLTNCCSDFIEYIQAKENRLIVPPAEAEFGKPKTEEFSHVRTSSVKGASGEKRAADIVPPEPSKRPKPHASLKPAEFRVSSPQVPNSKRKLPPQNSPDSRKQADGTRFVVQQESNTENNVISDLDLDWKDKSEDRVDTSIVKKENDLDRSNANDDEHMFIKEHETLTRSGSTSHDPDTIEIDLSDVKEEMDDSEQSFMSPQDQYTDNVPQMWFSPDTGTVESLNQSEPVISMNSPIGPSSFMQRSLTPSLKQLRAQQSIKRSIQSSMSAARRAKSLAGAPPTMVPTPSLSGDINNGSTEPLEESPGGGGSQENPPRDAGKEVEPYPVVGPDGRLRYACPTCGKLFTQKRHCRNHQNVHLKVKPFICKLCGSQYSYKCKLVEHERLKHGPEEFQALMFSSAIHPPDGTLLDNQEQPSSYGDPEIQQASNESELQFE